MSLVEQWQELSQGLDPRWSTLRLGLAVADESRAERAAALLGPAGPGRLGTALRLTVARGGTGIGPEALRRLLRRLDDERIEGTLELVSSEAAAAVPAPAAASLAAAWDAALAKLPADWSDLLCEVALRSSDHVAHAALLLSPLNPLHASGGLRLRFRVARTFGYGASPGMTRRCLERLDGDDVPGEVRVLEALSDTHPVGTQGPVWYVGGRAT